MVNNVFVRLLAGHLDHELWADFSGSGGGRRPSVQAGEGLGAQAGEARLTEVIRDGGFTKVHKATQGPFNMVFEARLGGVMARGKWCRRSLGAARASCRVSPAHIYTELGRFSGDGCRSLSRQPTN